MMKEQKVAQPQNITLIVAMNKERVIGVDNKLPWYIPEDLQFFKRNTLGKPIIMGRKTFESIGRALPDRQNIVITRNHNFVANDITIAQSLKAALLLCASQSEVCIIGGGEIFKEAMSLATKIYITIVDVDVVSPTTYFPIIDFSQWNLVNQSTIISKSGINCCFKEYIRIGE